MGQENRYAQYPEVETESRVRFFDGQFLNSQDFIDEQRFHVDRQRRHVHALHIKGIARGLKVAATGQLQVSVAPGTAIDGAGRTVALTRALTYALPGDLARPAEYVLCIAYAERGDRTLGGTNDQPGARGDTRIREEPAVFHYPGNEPAPEHTIGLAVLAVDQHGAVTVATPPNVRAYSGLRWDGPDGVGPTLTTAGDADPTELIVGGHLRVRGTLSIGDDFKDTKLAVWENRAARTACGLGVQAGQFRLHVDAPGTRFAFLDASAGRELVTITTNPGRLGVGRQPEHPLDVAGVARAADVLWGNINTRTLSRDDAGLRGDVGARSGFYETSAPVNFPAGAKSWWHLLDVRHSNPANNFALQLAGSFYDQQLFFRKTADNPATPWRRLLSIDDIAVNAEGKAGLGVGLVGVNAPPPRAHLDVAQAPRVGTHPTNVKGLYVTGDFGADRDGVEFRHSNGTQGVGIGYCSVYATGGNPDQHLNLIPRGGGGVCIGAVDPGGKLDVRVPGVGGWDRLVVGTTNRWDGSNQHVTLGAGGAHGVMFHNPHVVWHPGEGRASIRYAPTGADLGKPWWDAGARADGAFTIAVANSNHALRVEASGNVGIGVKPEAANRLQIAGGHLHTDGGSIFLRKGPADQQDVVKWNQATDRVDLGGYHGTTLGYTSDAGANNVTPVLEVTKGRVDVRVPGVGGWDRLVVTTANGWNGAAHVTLGAGGAHGIMLNNPHIQWIAAESRASIRYAHTNADSSKTWWDVGARADGAFTVAINNGNHALRVEENGNVGLGVKPENGNRLQLGGGHVHTNGGSLFLRQGPADQQDVVKWNAATDRVDIGGWNGVTIGHTSNAGANTVSPVLEVTPGRVDVRVAGVGGWDRLVVTAANQWNGGDAHVTLGAGTGGIMFHNPHVQWIAGEARASIRYAHVGADSSKHFWDVGARGDGAFTVAVNNGLHALRVEPSGDVRVHGKLFGPTTRPVQEQMVHRRPLYGVAGDGPLGYDSGAGALLHGVITYGPFGYGVPPVQPGAQRRFRVYAVYSDNMAESGATEVHFRLTTDWSDNASGGLYVFRLGLTWGDPAHRRDAHSDWYIGQPPGHHGFIKVRASAGGRVGRLYYLELQTWDFFV